MSFQSAEQVLAKRKSQLGDEFGATYFHAFSEWCELWVVWKQFRNLFCHGRERVDLMNRCGAEFFARVDRLFLEGVLLAICRLNDPVKSSGKPNLTVKRFAQFMTSEDHKQEMQALLEEVEDASDFARDWRNRRISHSDYHLKLFVDDAEPLQGFKPEDIDAAISALFRVFSYVSVRFTNTALDDEVIDQLNNEMVMIDRLFLGDNAFQHELEQLKNGKMVRDERPAWLANG